ncbi:MAG: hypothetical protein IPM25_15810 [Chloracidobacterium sp.]|nr:hypothetical protein [Chloracidobacterium sp.]
MRTAILLTMICLVTLFQAASGQNCAETARIVPPTLSDQTRSDFEQKLADAIAARKAKPDDPDALIWVGRRTAYLGRYKEAVRIFTEGIAKFPADARMYRHRGHRNITLRCFDDAVRDFEKAASLIKGKPDEVEPDGLPNAKNIPTSTLQSNIWYHLGLAYYVKGGFKKALRAYEQCEKVSKNNDMRAATVYWHYMTLRRLGRRAEAEKLLREFATDVEVIENRDYLDLIKLNKGEVKAEALLSKIRGDANTLGSASLGYGIGNYFLYNGDKENAMTIFRKIVEGDQWASFGYIAAEAELSRSASRVPGAMYGYY